MAIIDKLKSVGAAIKGRVEETFGEGSKELAGSDMLGELVLSPGLDAQAARRALEVSEDATLAEVREAYRRMARAHYGRARREGPDSAAAAVLERALESLELLEEQLLPLGGPASTDGPHGPGSQRKRATPRAP